MPIPDFEADTGNLPAGIHEATWDEIAAALGTSARRVDLVDGLWRALAALRVAGCKRVFVDGSFVTAKEHPGDFDACWDARGVDPSALDPVLLDFKQGRAAQKAKYGGELFIANAAATPAAQYFWTSSKSTRRPVIRRESSRSTLEVSHDHQRPPTPNHKQSDEAFRSRDPPRRT
jgi:hypothetical protein